MRTTYVFSTTMRVVQGPPPELLLFSEVRTEPQVGIPFEKRENKGRGGCGRKFCELCCQVTFHSRLSSISILLPSYSVFILFTFVFTFSRYCGTGRRRGGGGVINASAFVSVLVPCVAIQSLRVFLGHGCRPPKQYRTAGVREITPKLVRSLHARTPVDTRFSVSKDRRSPDPMEVPFRLPTQESASMAHTCISQLSSRFCRRPATKRCTPVEWSATGCHVPENSKHVVGLVSPHDVYCMLRAPFYANSQNPAAMLSLSAMKGCRAAMRKERVYSRKTKGRCHLV